MLKTKNSRFSPAAICRKKKWKVGDCLIGDEGYGPTVIKLTAIGIEEILAITISHNGNACVPQEACWVLHCREWTKLKPSRKR